MVSLPDKTVVVEDAAGTILRQYAAFVGSPDYPTPAGEFRVIENIVPDPSESKFGGRWIGFHTCPDSAPGTVAYIGFHGWVYDETDDEEEQLHPGWKTSTRGCVQLDNRDIADLAELVKPGDRVTVVM
jgi:lipoprotein-anchoring transpeptidase ErfK/SrfK